jgi:protein SCO1/2
MDEGPFARWWSIVQTGPVRPAALLAPLCLLAAACGGDDDATGLKGITRDDPLVVADVTIPEETNLAEGDEPTPFTFVAEPGELMVVYFGYTNCPDLCPTTMTAVKQAKTRIDPDEAARVDLAMVTVDPARDTGEILSLYLSSFSDRYHALRTEDVDQLAAAEEAFLASSTVTTRPDGAVEVSHTAAAYVVDDRGVVVVEWPFGVTPEIMADDLAYLFDHMEQGAST